MADSTENTEETARASAIPDILVSHHQQSTSKFTETSKQSRNPSKGSNSSSSSPTYDVHSSSHRIGNASQSYNDVEITMVKNKDIDLDLNRGGVRKRRCIPASSYPEILDKSVKLTENQSEPDQISDLVKDICNLQVLNLENLDLVEEFDLEIHGKGCRHSPISIRKPRPNVRFHHDRHQHSAKGEICSLSDLSASSDDDNYLSGLRKSKSFGNMKLLTSSLSSLSLSDDQDSVSRFLSEKSVLSSDDTEFYNDWDPVLNSFGNEGTQGNQDEENDDNDCIPEKDLQFPHRASHVMECEICLHFRLLRRRVCCDYQICNKCLSTYITLKVKDGKVQLECPNDRCNAFIFKDEIYYRLSTGMREKFTKFLIDANADPYIKTCPSCSLPYRIDPALLNVNKRKLKYGLKVVCTQCKLVWCYPCHAPLHSPLSCKKYKKEDEMVKRWAKEKKAGQANARRCPKCKIFIQKKEGCDHMQCSHCNTDFCYRCGDRYISIKLLGNHWSRFSLFGCKYRLLPQKPALRRLIRGTNFGARLVAAVVLAGVGVAAGAILLGASVFILPGYGILQLRRNMWARKKRKKFHKQQMLMIAAIQKERDIVFLDSQGYMSTIPEESETETSNPTSDPQQIQVLVHRSVSFNKDEPEDKNGRECDVLVNKYFNDDAELIVSRVVEENNTIIESTKDEDVVMVTDVQEIKNDSGYSTVVCNIVSRVNPTGGESEVKAENIKHQDRNGLLETEVEVCHVDCDNTVDKDEDDALIQGSANKVQIFCDRPPHHETLEEHADFNDQDQENLKKKIPLPTQVTDVDDRPVCQVDKKSCSELEDKPKEKEEKVKEKEIKLKEKEDKLRDKEIQISKSKTLSDKAPVSEIIIDKATNNGCFGNIFSSSKRMGSPSPVNQEVSKSETKSSKAKDLFSVKSATWEKCRKTNKELEPKAPVELTADIKQLPYYLQKSPSSLSSIISFSYGTEEEGKGKGSESLKPTIKIEAPLEFGAKKGNEEQQQGECDTSIESGYNVSQFNLVTRL